jgi:RNA 2',3'-cyclic 3'-phosphodiesterase
MPSDRPSAPPGCGAARPGEAGACESGARKLFVGTRIAVAAANALAGASETLARRARDAGLDVKWVAPANYHVTLEYLGWTRSEAIVAIGDALVRAVAGTPRFELQVARLGGFASLDRASVVWAGIVDPAPLVALAGKVAAAMTALGYQTDARPYVPHVTLARLRTPAAVREVVLPLAEQMFGGGAIAEVLLYESETKPTGSVYRELRRIGFQTASQTASNGEKRQIDRVELSASEDTDDGWPRGHS